MVIQMTEKLYKESNPDSNMNVPSIAYERISDLLHEYHGGRNPDEFVELDFENHCRSALGLPLAQA